MRSFHRVSLSAVGAAGTFLLFKNDVHVSHNASCLAEKDSKALKTRQEENAKAYEITQRLRAGLNEGKIDTWGQPDLTGKLDHRARIKSQYEKSIGGIDVFTLYDKQSGSYTFGSTGLPIARVASVEIKGDVKSIAAMWSDAQARQQWDKTAASTSITVSAEDGVQYSYFRGKAGWLIPAREFVYTSVALPPAVVGLNSINSMVVFQKDAHDKLPSSGAWAVVRGKMNSLLVLEPVGHSRTKATLLVECDAKGLGWLLGSSAVDFLAGDSTVRALWWLKVAIEEDLGDDSLSIEAAAQKRFTRKQERERELGATIVDHGSANSKEDIQETVRILEARLQALSRDEKEAGLNLGDLKARVRADLAKARAKL